MQNINDSNSRSEARTGTGIKGREVGAKVACVDHDQPLRLFLNAYDIFIRWYEHKGSIDVQLMSIGNIRHDVRSDIRARAGNHRLGGSYSPAIAFGRSTDAAHEYDNLKIGAAGSEANAVSPVNIISDRRQSAAHAAFAVAWTSLRVIYHDARGSSRSPVTFA